MVSVPHLGLAERWRRIRDKPGPFIALMLLLISAAILSNACFCYFREQRLANEIRSLGGNVTFTQQSRPRLHPPILAIQDRIETVSLAHAQVSSNLVVRLGSLRQLTRLSLTATQVRDADLGQLKQLGNLQELYLSSTQTTAQGRAMLRKALPNCRITPDP